MPWRKFCAESKQTFAGAAFAIARSRTMCWRESEDEILIPVDPSSMGKLRIQGFSGMQHVTSVLLWCDNISNTFDPRRG
jgi:hypothetical protein